MTKLSSLFSFQTKAEKLMTALRSKDFNKALDLVQQLDSRQVNYIGKDSIGGKYSYLKTAAFFGYKEICEILIQKGADLDYQDNSGWTALMYAISQHYDDIAKLLINKGANYHLFNHAGYTALQIASTHGQFEIIKLLLEKGDNLNVKDKNGMTPLMNAIDTGRNEIVKFFLDAGVELDSQTNEGTSALMLASSKGNAEIVKLMLDKGALLDLQSNNEGTALMVASQNGHKDVVELLLNKGANPKFLQNLFKKKVSSELDEAIRLHEKHNYSSSGVRQKISSELSLLQMMEEIEQALKEGNVNLAVTLFEKAANLTTNEFDRKQLLNQAENLKRVK